MKPFIRIALVTCGLAACAHKEPAPAETAASTNSQAAPKEATKESKTSQMIRKRAAFDLGCAPEQIQVAQIEEGSFMHAATYGATCGEKRVSYIERMGTIIKQ